jgi:hypothetical protein
LIAEANATGPRRCRDILNQDFPLTAIIRLTQLTPQALGTFHKAEIDKWWPIIWAAGIKGE